MKKLACLLVIIFITCWPNLVGAQSLPKPVEQLEFWPVNILPGEGGHMPGNYREVPISRFQSFKARHQGFVLHMGDLTDGGRKNAKWQWNYEYFQGITQLHSRIPVFLVPGNGEGDLYWYKKYHKLGEEEAYYTFQYGNAEFFMLNSNERETGFRQGGAQYKWLEEKLADTEGRLRDVMELSKP